MSQKLMDLRRNRLNSTIRHVLADVELSPRQMIQPYFVYQGLQSPMPLTSIYGQMKHNVESLKLSIKEGLNQGVRSVLLFFIPDKKSNCGFDHSFDASVLEELKRTFGDEIFLITDMCLCSQTSSGHCGILDDNGIVDNARSVAELVAKSLVHARAGSDCIAPSDMMDGRIGAIRQALNHAGMDHKLVMSYSSKFSSNLYGPFREAAESAPSKGDRKSYQIDYRNAGDAIRASLRDAKEGADFLMVKPAGTYLDILYRLKHDPELMHLPLAAYQVSGEYQSIALMAEKGLVDFEKALLESLYAIRRSGADLIITYAANQVKKLLEKHT